MEEEAERAQTYLAPTTEPLLIALLEQTLISAHLSAILEHPASGLSTLIQDSRIDDLRLLYTLFGRVATGHATLQAAISKWIVEIGTKINEGLSMRPDNAEEDDGEEDGAHGKGKGKAVVKSEDADGDKQMKSAKPAPKESAASARARSALNWVQNVLDLKLKFDTILEKACSSDKAFEKSFNDVSAKSGCVTAC